ncbi:MAG: extracellular solute-binding protein [Clostridia bacterium]|jgi:lactose/L-arabinose transport system substrate-binding protein|nr:extracellular solute-binding protein [Clostridia bacterium]
MIKKIISSFVVAAMALSMVACGSNAATTESAKTEPTKEAESKGAEPAKEAEAAPAADDNTLTVWCWDPAFNVYAMNQAAEVYKKDNPNFVLNVVETPWQDVQTKLTTAASSGDLSTLPDILLMQDNAFQKNVISYPDAFTDLTDSGIAFKDFGASKVAYSTVDGKNYGVPFDNGAVISCLRTDVLKEAGFTPADFTDITWSKYIELGKVVLEKTGKPLLSMQAGESDLIMMMLQSAGASLFDQEGKPNIVNNAVLEKVLSTYAELVTSGILIQVNDWDQYIGTLTDGTVAGTINGCWILGSIQTAENQKGLWEITNMPKLDGIQGATNYSNNGGSSWAVTANCKNVKLANDFLAKTFAGSVEFYETILPSSGALANYIPAGKSDVYGEPQAFFNNQKVFSMITEFASKVPSNNTGVYYYEARDAVATALTNTIAGADLKSELETAQSTVEFAMGQ